MNLGMLYASQGRDADAVRALRRAVEANPKFYRGLYELASGLDRMGELDEAVRRYLAWQSILEEKLTLNLAVGGVFFWGIDPGSVTIGSPMQVDWVKVFTAR